MRVHGGFRESRERMWTTKELTLLPHKTRSKLGVEGSGRAAGPGGPGMSRGGRVVGGGVERFQVWPWGGKKTAENGAVWLGDCGIWSGGFRTNGSGYPLSVPRGPLFKVSNTPSKGWRIHGAQDCDEVTLQGPYPYCVGT